MRKIHSLLIAGLLATAASSVHGAPLAAESSPMGQQRIFGSPSATISNTRASWLPQLPVATTSYGSVGGIRRAFSGAEVQRARALKSATAATRALATDADLRGWVIWPQSMLGLYTLPKENGATFQPYGNAETGVINGGGYDDGHGCYHGIFYTTTTEGLGEIRLMHLDSETFDILEVVPLNDGGIIAEDVAMDPTTGDVYGCYLNGQGRCWGRGNYNTGARTLIRELNEDWPIAVGCDASGQFYGITAGSEFVKINKHTGEFTHVSFTDVPYQYLAGGCVDDTTGKLLVTYNTDMKGAGIYSVDLATGKTENAVTFTNPDIVVVGPFIPAGNVGDKVPMAPSISVSAPQGTMTVSYTIGLPTTLVDGTPIAGNVGWQLLANGQVVADGAAPAGESVTGTVVISESGMTEFAAVASTAAGKSLRAEQSIYVGTGLPAAPTNVTASFADGKIKLTWNAVTSATDGGYIDPSAIRYTVASADGSVIATGLSDTKYEFEVAIPDVNTPYTYTVRAVYGDKTSSPTTSNVVRLGAYRTPFATEFNVSDIFATMGYTVIDANEDGKTWGIRGLGKGAYYPYNSRMAADDWLITPAIRMEAGRVYPFSCVAYCESSTDFERIEVKAGKSATAEGMTMEIVPSTDITVREANALTLRGLIKPDVTGDYFIGLHAISDANKYWLTVPSLSIDAGLAYATPAGVENLTITPEATGALSVTGTFTLPSLDVTGTPLTDNVTVKILRNETLVDTRTGRPGDKLNFSDNTVPSKGDYTYTVVTCLGDEDGVAVKTTAFVGPYAAAAPTTVKVTETDQPGVVTVEWDAVTTDCNGTPLNPANVSYMVYSVDEEKNLHPMLDSNVSATSTTFQALADPSTQQFIQFAVTAFNRDARSESDVRTLDPVAVGKAYSMPVLYSGSESRSEYIVYTNSRGSGFWDFYSPAKLPGAPTPKATDDYYGCYAGAAELYGDLYTGKIDLTEATRPELTFYTYKFPAGGDYFYTEDVNFIEVAALVDGKLELIETVSHKNGMEDGIWNLARVDLSPYNGKSIQLMFRAVAKSGSYTLIDEMQVKEIPAYDVAALSILAPAEVAAETPFEVKVNVVNLGYREASDFDVVLYRNGDIARTEHVSALAPGQEKTLTFDNVISYFDEMDTEAVFSAEVIFPSDEVAGNNVSDEITVNRPVLTHPAVTDLSAEKSSEGVKLIWSVYSPADLPAVEKAEDFETARPWTQEFGHWTFVSLSDSPVGMIYDFTLPGIEYHTSMCSWYVINNDGAQSVLPSSNGGYQFIASLLKSDKQINDDWAISPRLSGDAQRISFYAKSYNARYLESFEIWYTTSDSVDPDDYVKLEETDKVTVPVDWTSYSFQLPEGALHFAVRCVSKDCYMLMLDDFSFTPDPLLYAPTLIGYDIYRDGVKLNDTPVATGEYLDTDVNEGRHTYHVVARYAEGASELSNPASIDMSGIETVAASDFRVYADGLDIVISGAAQRPVSVVTIDGKTLLRAVGDRRLTVIPSLYLVTVGDTTVKLIVK